MDVHLATELAYKNGYKAGLEAEKGRGYTNTDRGFCEKCGTRIPATYEDGTPISKTWVKYCLHCGAEIVRY